MSDGLVSNLALVAGVAGADASSRAVLVGGIAGLVSGALSMAIGEWVSVRADRQLRLRELAVERDEIANDPAGEMRELAGIYVDRGLDRTTAIAVAERMMEDPERALRAHAREELNLDPDDLASPWVAAASSFAAFAIGAMVPVVPWMIGGGTAALMASLALGVIAAALLGGGLAAMTRRSVARGATLQVGLLVLAFAITSVIGRAVGAAL
jgi:vacuolar iron transporter family protein